MFRKVLCQNASCIKKFGIFMKFLTPLCRACSRGRDHGRGQKNAGETISFTLLTLTSFSCTALLFFQLAPTTALQ